MNSAAQARAAAASLADGRVTDALWKENTGTAQTQIANIEGRCVLAGNYSWNSEDTGYRKAEK